MSATGAARLLRSNASSALALFTLAALAVLAVLALAACASAAAPSPTPTSAPAAEPAPDPAAPVPPPAAAESGLPDIASTVERLMPAVVQIIATLEEQTVMGMSAPNVSQGSGFFFREDGYLLTNEHVIADAVSIEAVLSNRHRLPAEVIGVDVATDLAVLKVDPDEIAEEDVAVARLGSADAMRIGEWVIAIGSPLGFQGSVSVGVISAKGRSLGAGTDRLNDLVQTDAVINPGNSGGPLLNLAGEVVGINTRVIRQTGFVPVDGIGFAISADTANPVSDHLIEFGRVARPRIGVTVQDVTPTVATERGLTVDEGALVISVAPGGPAERAGIEEDDVIVRLDDLPVTSTSQLVRTLLTDYRVGDAVRLGVVRAAVHLSFDLTLEEVPVDGADADDDDDENGDGDNGDGEDNDNGDG